MPHTNLAYGMRSSTTPLGIALRAVHSPLRAPTTQGCRARMADMDHSCLTCPEAAFGIRGCSQKATTYTSVAK